MKITFETKYNIGDIVYTKGDKKHEYVEYVVEEVRYVENTKLYISYGVKKLRNISIIKTGAAFTHIHEDKLFSSIEEVQEKE